MADRIQNLRKICQGLDELEKDTDKNFWVVNMHGDEIPEKFTVPEGVRIIMFCYPGCRLNIWPKFDRFNWREIFMNEDASYNYCTFLSNIVQYPSLRDHFCVYDAGKTVDDLVFSPDENFRSGIYNLPVYGAVYDKNSNTVFSSSEKVFAETVKETVKVGKIVVDKNKTADMIKDKFSPAIFFSKHFEPEQMRLSELVRKLSVVLGSERKKGFTLLLLTCRTGEKRWTSTFPPTAYQELEKLYKKYSV